MTTKHTCGETEEERKAHYLKLAEIYRKIAFEAGYKALREIAAHDTGPAGTIATNRLRELGEEA